MPSPSDTSSGARRGFLKIVTGVLGGLLGALALVPGLGMLLHPLRRETVKGARDPLRVASARSLEPGRPVKVDVRGELNDAWSRVPDVKLGSCWLVKNGDEGRIRAYSTVCPHLGCGIDWSETDRRFVCPCHHSFFSQEGRMLTGPSPRDLDELEVDVEGDDVKVAYRRFRIGIPRKVEA